MSYDVPMAKADRFTKQPARRPRDRFPFLVGAVFILALGAGTALQRPQTVATPASAAVPAVAVASPPWPRCGGGGSRCVIDGDTIKMDGVTIRIADIDAPETGGARCESERALGDRATARLAVLLAAGPIELRSYDRRGVDQYGRSLRVVERDGRSLGSILVAEGLARPWTGKRRPWC